MNPAIMTAREIAEYLGIHKNTVYRRARLGTIPCVRIFGFLRFRRSDVEAVKNGQGETLEVPGTQTGSGD